MATEGSLKTGWKSLLFLAMYSRACPPRFDRLRALSTSGVMTDDSRAPRPPRFNRLRALSTSPRDERAHPRTHFKDPEAEPARHATHYRGPQAERAHPRAHANPPPGRARSPRNPCQPTPKPSALAHTAHYRRPKTERARPRAHANPSQTERAHKVCAHPKHDRANTSVTESAVESPGTWAQRQRL